MGKRIINIVLMLTLVVSITQGALTVHASTQEPSSWAVETVEWAIVLGIVPQNLQSNYTQPITRAEFAVLAVTFYEFWHGEIAGRSYFNDTNDINVQKAAYVGLVSGIGNNMFAPNSQLTREQAAVMLSRLAYLFDIPLPNQTTTFADMRSISNWALDAVGQMQATGIMGGIGNNMFSPQGQYTREQSIITIVRLNELIMESIFSE